MSFTNLPPPPYTGDTDVDYRLLGLFRKFNDGLQNIQNSASADNGNLAATIYAGTSARTQVWNTAITADRAVTLSTTNAVNGSKFRVVRTAAATGAFNLNVGTGPLKALAAGTWCDVEYDGSAWFLSAYGSL